MDCVFTTTNPELEWFSLDRGTTVTLALEMEIFDKIGDLINSGTVSQGDFQTVFCRD